MYCPSAPGPHGQVHPRLDDGRRRQAGGGVRLTAPLTQRDVLSCLAQTNVRETIFSRRSPFIYLSSCLRPSTGTRRRFRTDLLEPIAICWLQRGAESEGRTQTHTQTHTDAHGRTHGRTQKDRRTQTHTSAYVASLKLAINF